MNLWIELTEVSDNDKPSKIAVNINHISRFSDSWNGDTYICFGLDDEIYVKESYAEVKQKIQDAMNSGYVLVTSESKND